MNRYVRSFGSPDEVIEVAGVRSALISKGGLTVAHDVHAPGWRWSTHVRPIVRTEWCELHHVGVILTGRLQVVLADGTEFHAGPVSLVDIPPRHDAWVVGEEPVEMITWLGAKEWLTPLRALGERVLVTLLFTDIVDSTGFAVRLGDRGWDDLLATLESRSRDIVERYRGRIVKWTGDGMLATFDGAARALRAASAVAEAARDLDIQVRAATHTGEVELGDDDIRGIAIHEASRMMALGGPGEVLVSATTAGLVADGGFALEDIGEQELRGFSGKRRLYALRPARDG